MDFVRIASNPWGQEVLLGLAWDVLWVVAALGALFVVVHAVFYKKEDVGGATDGAGDGRLNVGGRASRHGVKSSLVKGIDDGHLVIAVNPLTADVHSHG